MQEQPPEKFVDLAKLLNEAPLDSWIAFNQEHSAIVGYGKTLKEALDQAKKNGFDEPVLFKTPNEWIPRVFSQK